MIDRFFCWLGWHNFDLKNSNTSQGLIYQNGHVVGHTYACIWCINRLRRKGIGSWEKGQIGEKEVYLKEII